jgi:hypothetical protein
MCGADITGRVKAHFETTCRQFGSRPGPPPRAHAPRPPVPNLALTPLVAVRALFTQSLPFEGGSDRFLREFEGFLEAMEECVLPFNCSACRRWGRGPAPCCARLARLALTVLGLAAQCACGCALALGFAVVVYGAYGLVALPLAALLALPYAALQSSCCSPRFAYLLKDCFGRTSIRLAQLCFVLAALPVVALFVALNLDSLLASALASAVSRCVRGSFEIERPVLLPLGAPLAGFFLLGAIALGVDCSPFSLVDSSD